MNDRTELANRLREHANQSKSLATWIRELGANDSARTAKYHEAKAADLTAAADLIEREAAAHDRVRMPEPMTQSAIFDVAMARLSEVVESMLAALKGMVSDLENLVSESDGVYGLHLNGDGSPWDELLEGGRFERLSHLSAALAAISMADEMLKAREANNG